MIRPQAVRISPKTSRPATIFMAISTTWPRADTASATMGLALRSASLLAAAVSRIDCAVMRSPFISSFWRGERAAGTTNQATQ